MMCNEEHCKPHKAEDLIIQQVGDEYLVLHEEKRKVHFLNHTAIFILELCDGRHEVSEIYEIFTEAFSLTDPPMKEIEGLMDKLIEEGLLRID